KSRCPIARNWKELRELKTEEQNDKGHWKANTQTFTKPLEDVNNVDKAVKETKLDLSSKSCLVEDWERMFFVQLIGTPKSAKPKIPANHPPVIDMVKASINAAKDRKNTSLPTIKKFIGANHKIDVEKLGPHIRRGIVHAVEKGVLVRVAFYRSSANNFNAQFLQWIQIEINSSRFSVVGTSQERKYSVAPRRFVGVMCPFKLLLVISYQGSLDKTCE
ncbi:linker histone H1 and H5 family protein, partial [Opisthorchis viverrini]